MPEINKTGVVTEPFLALLKEFQGSPAFLYYKGTLPFDRPPCVAIVGSRRPTHYGKEVTYDLAYKLAQRGVIIISGLALGIDGIAHRAALDAGGITIAVLAGGLDTIYPRTHAQLAKEIISKGGALVTEYEAGTPAKPYQFLARNRIVSGLADAVVITEAAARSGTLSTVMHALEQGKEVFAVPGNITSVLSVGPNTLLSQGARPLLSVDDVLEVVIPHFKQTLLAEIVNYTPLEARLIKLMKSGVQDADILQEQSGEVPAEVLSSLTMLELKGTVRSIGGEKWTLS